jgi:hypothetical protein
MFANPYYYEWVIRGLILIFLIILNFTYKKALFKENPGYNTLDIAILTLVHGLYQIGSETNLLGLYPHASYSEASFTIKLFALPLFTLLIGYGMWAAKEKQKKIVEKFAKVHTSKQAIIDAVQYILSLNLKWFSTLKKDETDIVNEILKSENPAFVSKEDCYKLNKWPDRVAYKILFTLLILLMIAISALPMKKPSDINKVKNANVIQQSKQNMENHDNQADSTR